MSVTRNEKNGEAGASLVEYALLVALIAVVCIVAVAFLAPPHTLSEFDGASVSEGKTFVLDEGINDSARPCGLQVDVQKPTEMSRVIFVEASSMCLVETKIDRGNSEGFVEIPELNEEDGLRAFSYFSSHDVDYAFRVCEDVRRPDDSNCVTYRLNGPT